ncbi:30S ribosomal protein S2 [Candidatus Daviesbacteria bacterium RIFCSPLOWO2_02_FULL_40_8]|uniref:Small ribosomal subunit protein uS2 n=1 Tax=Candidatus Daviesbacteria bacterium RIFCSPLOWO2_01_FULL_40_24 TaxID=1797787 RepID=A0A1F5MJI6_9BACT|nr:MAG: 30S ribosomal protein S2 [Candidatus Daviesbacteria bacterium RIFCSPHIGHO2_01_FULL_41_45]OGE35456.1 MAG: 30S ribosomal protein S2 [Candidatus Daviesbacteria bacterium RIFCSPHIGHO2_02_FULL_41_14]OGE65546.1 MAG: 30S ribosomal protein S2 [Candidatus Daviesbacteria bacterium RIFCSPLOWO2_01_FULL_40_24]OGE67108.1 MAG: 30S ribosomal protein S2 [Candidatus Daviesbacteria bacterium RIFCSPLOWO2_02_FULL_40_8]
MPSTIKVPTMQELLEAGVHFGHQTRRSDPRMMRFIFGERDGVHIINLEQSEAKLKEACEFVYDLGKNGKVLLFVGSKKQAQPLIEEAATRVKAPYVTFKWMGGLLTNFDEIKKNINKLNALKEEKAKGELTRYTKKEQLLITRKLVRFELQWGGVASMEGIPAAIFVVDSVGEKTAVNEATRVGIPVVAISDSNSNPLIISHPIPGNDDATKSLKILIDAVADSYGKGLQDGGIVVGTVKPADSESKPEETVGAVIATEVAVAEEEVEKKVLAESERKVV